MQSLHFWLHCFALWHISSLLFNKPKQVFTFSSLGTYPKQGLEQCQSRTTESGQALAEHQHSQEHSYVWEELKPFQRHGQTWKESTRALFQWETPPASGTAPAFTWKSQAQNTRTESTAVIYAGRMRSLTSLCSHFPELSQETGGHLDSLMK